MKIRVAPPVLIGLLILLIVPLSAHASCGGGTVAPGDSICLQPFYSATNITAVGTSDVNVRFTVSESGTTLFMLTGTSFGFDSSTNPATVLPGYFLVCAERKPNHTTSANVTLCISN